MVPQLDGRIVGGYETSIEAHPYQVSLQRSGSHFCGGSIYSHDIVITAAHCLQSIAAKDLKVRVGSTYWRSGGSVHSVRTFRNHEGYNARTMINDIAIIRLESNLSLRSTIREIRIADSNPREGASAVVSGWGTTESGGSTIPDHLLAVNLEIVDIARCRSSEFGYGSKIKDTMLCAYAAHKDACQGDSGGPLVSEDRLVGVVSWGYGCADDRYPGVYADVAHFHSWIEDTARDLLVAVASFRNHEGYNANTMVNDIAVIRLSSSLSFSSSIKAIGLATYNPANGAAATVSGWGTLSSGSSSIPTQLQYVNLNIVSQAKCASSTYGYGSQIKSTMICAYSSGKDSCQGDSGGPLVSGGVLVGVVSWGYGCAYANYPGVYADVAVLRTWVVSTANSI
ncbi:hypothetical protein KR032_010044 [Drosophila birchii]|nr:hypothetical protein KR032_010044 [Drosophila birchii]